MKILAEWNGQRVYIVNIRDEKGLCDIIRTKYDEKTEQDTGELLLVGKKDLKIVDDEYLIDSLKEHVRHLNIAAEKNKNKEQTESLQLSDKEKKMLNDLTNSLNYRNPNKKEIF